VNWRVEVTAKKVALDSEGKDVLSNARDLSLKGLDSIRTGWIYVLDDTLDASKVALLADRLLSDPIEHQYVILEGDDCDSALVPGSRWEVEVHYKKGVTDTTAESLARGAEDLGITNLKGIRTGRIYWLFGTISLDDANRLASGLLANGIVQEYTITSRHSDERVQG